MTTEANFLFACYAFDQLGYRRYEWKCNALNAPSRVAAERFGFTYEGHFRRSNIVKGRSRDTTWYSIIEDEWPRLKAGYQRWLSADNFDAQSQQQRRLSDILAATKGACQVTTTPDPSAERLPPAPIKFRVADLIDRPAVERLQQAAYARNRKLLGVEPLPLKVDYAEVFVSKEVWLAEERDVLRGVLILELREEDLLIWSIAAAPDAQGQGLGHMMLDAAEVRAHQLGRHVMRLYTGAVLEGLIGWYHRHGYEIERHEQLSDRHITHMIKHLDPVSG